jgi:hypothetical protein
MATAMDKADLFLPRHSAWMRRAVRVPVRPTTGDRGPAREALLEVVDAAGGVERSRTVLEHALRAAYEEFKVVAPQMPDAPSARWAGANTPAVYYDFYDVVTWTRAVEDRLPRPPRPQA